MFDQTDFQQVFPAGSQFPYDKKLQQQLESYRKEHGGTLFIDRVLGALGITKAKSYPPKTENALRQLHQQICEATVSAHHKSSLFYYILLDFPAPKSQQESAPEIFAVASSTPMNYQIFMRGLWHLDRFDFATALEYITHPSLNPDFADDIITTLVRHAPNGDYSFALSYFHTLQPILKTSEALGYIFDAMAQVSLSEALMYSRTFADYTREQLFQRLAASALDGKAASNGQSSELAFLPLDSTEEAWLADFLAHGGGKDLKKAKDTLLIRKIAGDDFAEVSKIRGGGAWANVISGIKGGIEGHSD